MYRDGYTTTVALGKVIALQHLRNGISRRQLNHAARAQWITPFAVIADFSFIRVKDHARLTIVSLGIDSNFFCSQWWACCIASRRITNHAGEITNQENHGVT
jgi:hypothetical protein